MPRPLWSGTVSFGLVSIPVKLFPAVSKKSVQFNQIDARTGSRIKLRKVSAADGTEVPDGEIVKGYEVSKDRYVIMEPAELEALEVAASRSIELQEFVELAEIDPVFFDTSYHLAPDKGAAKPYALLARAMQAEQRVGIARFVRSNKEHLAAIRPTDGHLVMATMVYADEVVQSTAIDELGALADIEISDRELAMASQLIESLAGPFEPERYRDTYRDQLLEMIERKASGLEPLEVTTPAPAAAQVVDLLAALEASVAEAKASRQRHPTAKAADEAVEAPEPVAAAPAKRRRKSA